MEGENVKNRTRKKREMKNNSDQDQWKAGRRCGRKKEGLEDLWDGEQMQYKKEGKEEITDGRKEKGRVM